jgi:transaldolase
MTRPKTKILVDGGDPQETRQVKELLGFVDGQTTNPSLIAKNPHIKELIASGHVLVLAASISSLEHLLYCFDLQTELATVPAKILEQWASRKFPTPDNQFQYKAPGKPIPYEEPRQRLPSDGFFECDASHLLSA